MLIKPSVPPARIPISLRHAHLHMRVRLSLVSSFADARNLEMERKSDMFIGTCAQALALIADTKRLCFEHS